MTLTITKLGKIIGSNLRTLADGGDWRAAARSAADALDPQSVPKPPAAPTPNGINDASLRLVWRDEFDGGWPDAANWRQGERNKANGNHAAPGYPDNSELEFYQAGQVSKHDSLLDLKASQRVVKVVQVAHDDELRDKFVLKSGTPADPDLYYWEYYSATFQYQSGWASTGPDVNGWIGHTWQPQPSLHEFLYGVVEVSVKLPKGAGYWPAVWMLRSDGGGSEEIDLFEVVDPAARKMAHHYHCPAIPDWTKDVGPGRDTQVDLSAGFHTVAIDWTKDYVRWYFEGTLVQSTEGAIDPSKICKYPMYIIANLAVGGGWPGPPNAQTTFPQSLLVDYVRVWQR